MSAQRREHFSTLATVGAKSPTRPFTPYEVKVREMSQAQKQEIVRSGR
jgi:hypothetical protein